MSMVNFKVKDIVEKYGRWENTMKNGKWITVKIISKRSMNKMVIELSELISNII